MFKRVFRKALSEWMKLWEHLRGTEELEHLNYTAADKYITFYDKHSKGKESHANLYLTCLNYISSLTCRSQPSLANLCTLTLLLQGYDSPIYAENSNCLYTS